MEHIWQSFTYGASLASPTARYSFKVRSDRLTRPSCGCQLRPPQVQNVSHRTKQCKHIIRTNMHKFKNRRRSSSLARADPHRPTLFILPIHLLLGRPKSRGSHCADPRNKFELVGNPKFGSAHTGCSRGGSSQGVSRLVGSLHAHFPPLSRHRPHFPSPPPLP